VSSVAEAIRQLAAPGARLHAGGTDLLGCLRDGVFTAERVVSRAGGARVGHEGVPAVAPDGVLTLVRVAVGLVATSVHDLQVGV